MNFKNLRSKIGKLFSVRGQIYIVKLLSFFFWSLKKYFLGIQHDKDDLFENNWQIINSFSFIDKERNYNIYNLTKLHNEYFKNQKTYAIEFGCAKGSTLISMGNFLHNECFIIGIDQFGEFDENLSINDIYDDQYKNYNPFGKKGVFKKSNFNKISSFVQSYSNNKNFKLINGVFPNKIKDDDLNFLINLKFSFVHLDFDLFDSTLDALEFIIPRLMKYGILIIDDFSAINQNGVKQACKKSSLNLNKTFETSSGQLIYINIQP